MIPVLTSIIFLQSCSMLKLASAYLERKGRMRQVILAQVERQARQRREIIRRNMLN